MRTLLLKLIYRSAYNSFENAARSFFAFQPEYVAFQTFTVQIGCFFSLFCLLSADEGLFLPVQATTLETESQSFELKNR